MPYTDEQIREVMDDFFDTMNHVQYVGARYAPIFGRKDEESIEWDNTKPYEPLTIVTYQGSSYTSRQEVPTGTDITNALYWVETGNYNSQIEAYRAEVERYRQKVDEYEDDIADIKSDIQGINTDIEGLNGNIVSLQEADENLDDKIDGVKTDLYEEALIRSNGDNALQEDINEIDNFLPAGYTSSVPMNDYIVAQGTATTTGYNVGASCHWLWRKWASGISECWGRHVENFNCNQEWGELYENYAIVAEVFPTDIFNSTPWFCHMGWTGTWLLCFEYGGYLTKERTQDFKAVRATEGEIEGTLMVYAMGTWK